MSSVHAWTRVTRSGGGLSDFRRYIRRIFLELREIPDNRVLGLTRVLFRFWTFLHALKKKEDNCRRPKKKTIVRGRTKVLVLAADVTGACPSSRTSTTVRGGGCAVCREAARGR